MKYLLIALSLLANGVAAAEEPTLYAGIEVTHGILPKYQIMMAGPFTTQDECYSFFTSQVGKNLTSVEWWNGVDHGNTKVTTACLTLAQLMPHLVEGACEKVTPEPVDLKMFGFPGRHETDYNCTKPGQPGND
jgi:hypothetical protein